MNKVVIKHHDNWIISIVILLISLASCTNNKPLSIVFTGDVILDRGVEDQLQLFGDSLLENALNLIGPSDYSVINFEGTFTKTGKKQNDKYNFKAQKKLAKILEKKGITHTSVANNHSYDYGKEGFENTIQTFQTNNIKPIGSNLLPTLLGKGKNKCQVIAAHIKHKDDETINNLIKSIRKHEKKDIPTILYLHWGLELCSSPTQWQKKLARTFVNNGADAIIGHHPHIIQSIEFIDDVPVFYSLGNFIADAYLPLTDKSFIVKLEINEGELKTSIKGLELKRYFPEETVSKKTDSYFSNSTNICIYQKGKYMRIIPSEKINFKENTQEWRFFYHDSHIVIRSANERKHFLSFIANKDTSNTICLHGQLTQFDFKDIDNDGEKDILLGIRKKVRFDLHENLRLNIFSYNDKNLQAKWLGTKFLYHLQSFYTFQKRKRNYLATSENDSLNKTHHAFYHWDNFGFALDSVVSKMKNKK